MKRYLWLGLVGLFSLSFGLANQSYGQTRDEKVRRDRELLSKQESWIYDDFEKGLQHAKATGKPLMVVLRCIP